MKNKMASVKVFFVKYLLTQPFDVQQIDAFEKLMQLRVFDLKTKFIISDKTLIRRSWGTVLYNAVKFFQKNLKAIFFDIYFNQICNNLE